MCSEMSALSKEYIDASAAASIIGAFEGDSAAIATFNYAFEDLHAHPHPQSQDSLDHDETLRLI